MGKGSEISVSSTRNSKFTKEYINKNADTLDWVQVSCLVDITSFDFKFIEKFKDDWSWNLIVAGIFLSEEFIEKFIEYIDLDQLVLSQYLSDKFILKHKERFTLEYDPSVIVNMTHKIFHKTFEVFIWEPLSDERRIATRDYLENYMKKCLGERMIEFRSEPIKDDSFRREKITVFFTDENKVAQYMASTIG